ncbi:tRNA (adenosine(37)-N6)-threonylcarbamoyltransferase complex transferase subunit TsaD [Candidatus Bipolaricaulota bacterium]|nr:tRNA (adenosine(37)-N6)-threonylcarbamoyltransferase complex transferase subunit TsaD [Candidatus Bipolaricaulota bacterium]
MGNFYTLGLESSCDETGVGIIRGKEEIIANKIYSQADLHEKYGGVVPEIASRNHLKKFSPLIEEALSDVGITLGDIDLVGATYGPGLVGPLLVGLSLGKSLGYSLDVPFLGINHLEAHVFAHYSSRQSTPPFLALLVSGGHTSLILVKDWGNYEELGSTRDDAAGEAFDKVGHMTGLGYPAGPKIDEMSQEGNPETFNFPRPMIEEGLDFSFAGLKSAVARKVEMEEGDYDLQDLLASFQEAVIDTLITKAIRGAKEVDVDTISVMGGVSANSRLRRGLTEEAEENDLSATFPPFDLCTDNGAMIGVTAAYKYMNDGETSPLSLGPEPSLSLG